MSGRGGRRASLTWSGIRSLILPAITLGLFQMTLIMRLVRAEMLEVLRTDYIKFARARGLTNRAINFGHALKNTLVPVITIIGLQFGGLVAFSLVTETVFQWPGMGLLLVQSVAVADIPVMSAYLHADRVCFRAHQPGGRSALLRGRSAAEGGTSRRGRSAVSDAAAPRENAPPGAAARFWTAISCTAFVVRRSRSPRR